MSYPWVDTPTLQTTLWFILNHWHDNYLPWTGLFWLGVSSSIRIIKRQAHTLSCISWFGFLDFAWLGEWQTLDSVVNKFWRWSSSNKPRVPCDTLSISSGLAVFLSARDWEGWITPTLASSLGLWCLLFKGLVDQTNTQVHHQTRNP